VPSPDKKVMEVEGIPGFLVTDIDDGTLAKMAEAVIRCMNMREGEAVWIRAGLHSWRFVEHIRHGLLVKGITSVATMASDWYIERIYRDVPEKYFALTPKEQKALAEAVDGVITIESPWDPTVMAKLPREKLNARTSGFFPVRKIILSKKWCYVGYPSEPMARTHGIPYGELKRLIIEGMLYDLDKLRSDCDKVAAALRGADWVRIKDEMGTDLELRISGRRINKDDGIISDEDVAKGDTGSNMPAGEVFIAPVETVGEGTLYCPLTRDRFTRKIIKGVKLVFKEGRLVLDKCEAEENEEDLKKTLESCLKIDEEKVRKGEIPEVRTINVAELGIGLNRAIDKAIGYILTDEKIGGSVHVAIGSNKTYGGTSESTLHWDFVTIPKVTIEVIYMDGSSRIIMEDGELKI